MPGDSTNINSGGVAQHSYDAIVIGSGISGGWAAKELCEQGLKTLVLERGKDVVHLKEVLVRMVQVDDSEIAHRIPFHIPEK